MNHWRRYLLRLEFALLLLLGLISAASTFAGPARIVPAGVRFTCTATHLWDGDGPIWCAEGPHVRLARINARELDGSCRRGAPCPRVGGEASRDHLAELLGGARGRTRRGHLLLRSPRLRCRSDGSGRGDRTAAWCATSAGDLSAAMIRDGFAAPWSTPRRS